MAAALHRRDTWRRIASRAATRSHRVRFQKGTADLDGYSAFEATNADLKTFLKDRGVDKLCVSGLSTDYCVRASVPDAARLGFRVSVITNAIAAVADAEPALREMRQAGIDLAAM